MLFRDYEDYLRAFKMSNEWVVRFEHPSSKSLITVLQALGNIVDESLVTFNEKGLSIKALDPAQIAMIAVEVPSDSFITYQCSKELSVGFNLANLLKTLPKPRKSDKLVFNANDEFYEFIYEGTTTKRYKYRSIEVSASQIPEIELDFKVRALAVAKAFRDAVKDLSGAGSLVFEVQDDQYLYLKAPELGAEARLSRIAGSLMEMEVKEPSRNTYDEDYISKVLNLATISDVIEIKFGSGIPLSLSFTITEGGSVKYLLAPKA